MSELKLNLPQNIEQVLQERAKKLNVSLEQCALDILSNTLAISSYDDTLKLEVQYYPNKDTVTIYSSLRFFHKKEFVEYNRNSCSESTLKLNDSLCLIPGCLGLLSVEPYQLDVQKAKLYEWSEIIPQIKAELLKFHRYLTQPKS